MTLRQIPHLRFPLTFERRGRIDDQLKQAAGRFSELGYEDLASEMDAVRARLDKAWDAITQAERDGR